MRSPRGDEPPWPGHPGPQAHRPGHRPGPETPGGSGGQSPGMVGHARSPARPGRHAVSKPGGGRLRGPPEAPAGRRPDQRLAGQRPPTARPGRRSAEATCRAELAERTADLQRLQAEYANYRKRVERDRAAVREPAVAGVLAELLPVLDDIGRARDARRADRRRSSRSARRSRPRSASSASSAFGEVGEPFDPTVHEALMHAYSAGRHRADVRARSCSRATGSATDRAPGPGRGRGAGEADEPDSDASGRDRAMTAAGDDAATTARHPRRRRLSLEEEPGEHEGLPREGLLQGPRRRQGRDAPTRSRRRTASSPASTTRTPTRATRQPRSGSRRSPRPTTCSPTTSGARSTTRRARCSARAASGCPAAGGGGGGGGFDLGDLFGGRRRRRQPADGSATCSAACSAAAAAGPPRQQRPRRGADVETEVAERSATRSTASTVPLRLTGEGPCQACRGTGAKAGTVPRVCPTCEGTGQVSRNQGGFAFSEPCRDVPGPRPGRRRPVPDLRGQRPAP